MRFLTATAIVAMLASTAASAQTAPVHTIDMTTPLHDADGAPLKDPSNNKATHLVDGKPVLDDPTCDKCPVMTVGDLIVRALYNVNDSDDPHAKQDGEKLWQRGILAAKLKGDKAAVLTTDQVKEIKELIAKGFPSPLLISQIFPLLNPNDKPPGPAK